MSTKKTNLTIVVLLLLKYKSIFIMSIDMNILLNIHFMATVLNLQPSGAPALFG